MENQIHEGEGCPQCSNNSYIRKSSKIFVCKQCGCELTVMSACGDFLMCSGNEMSSATEKFFLSDEESKRVFPPVSIMISRDGQPNQEVVVVGSAFLDRLEAISKSGRCYEFQQLIRTWKQQASKVPEYAGPNNTRCALCDGVFRKFKLFRRHSVISDPGIDFQVHDRCLKRFRKTMVDVVNTYDKLGGFEKK